ADGARRPCVERREDSRGTVCRHLLGAVKTGFPQHPDEKLAAFRDALVLRRNRGLMNPFLKPLDRLVMPLVCFGENGPETGGRPRRGPWPGRYRDARKGALQECASIHSQPPLSPHYS